MKRNFVVLATLFILLAVVACGRRESSSSASGAGASETSSTSDSSASSTATSSDTAMSSMPGMQSMSGKMGTMEGKIVSRDAAKNQLTLDHKKVEGMMEPMTMGYEVRGAKVDALPPDGTEVTAMLHEESGTYYLTDVKKK